MSNWISQRVYTVQKRIARRGQVSPLDVDPVRVRELVLAFDRLSDRASLRRKGFPLMRFRYKTQCAGRPAWYLV
jgi:hypothetical protein